MSGNKFGKAFSLTSFGESHGFCIGGIVDGMPPGLVIDLAFVQALLDARRPGTGSHTSPRQEPDQVEFLSGIFENKSTGTPIGFMIRNTDTRSSDYNMFRDVFRPGHGDYVYQAKYGIRDHRGGGRSSARETAIRVVGGALALIMLHHFLGPTFSIKSALVQIGSISIDRDRFDWNEIDNNAYFCPDPKVVHDWQKLLEESKEKGISQGALIELVAFGVPSGLGEPVYDKLDADLAKALMSINAVKGVEIGDGFSCVGKESGFDEMIPFDEENIDALQPHYNHQTLSNNPNVPKASFLSNHAGGILAGISSGQPIIARIAIKPTSSTMQKRRSIDQNAQQQSIQIGGRHDPCIGIRAVGVAKAMMALVLADHLLRWRGQCGQQW
jgi:chorismate synthase